MRSVYPQVIKLIDTAAGCSINIGFMQTSRPKQHTVSTALSRLYHAFDAVATWVTQLSWWKFFLFAALLLVSGKILQNELFTGSSEEIERSERGPHKAEPSVTIDDSGIYINQRGRRPVVIDPNDIAAQAQAAAKQAEAAKAQAGATEKRMADARKRMEDAGKRMAEAAKSMGVDKDEDKDDDGTAKQTGTK